MYLQRQNCFLRSTYNFIPLVSGHRKIDESEKTSEQTPLNSQNLYILKILLCVYILKFFEGFHW